MALKSQALAGPIGLSHADTRSHNRRMVVNFIRQFGPVSRRDLMDLTGLSRATIFDIGDELKVNGLVLEEKSLVPSGGRRASLLSINPDAGFAVGVEINSGDALLVVIDLIGSVRSRLQILHGDRSADEVLSLVGAGAAGILSEIPEAAGRTLGVGVSAPGVLDVSAGNVLMASNLEWSDTPVASLLEASLGLPVFISNHAVSGAVAELWLGDQRDAGSYLYIYIGSGIGAGLVWKEAAGKVRTQSLPWFGHTSTNARGPECRCGNFGCLELSASTVAAARSYGTEASLELTPSWSEVAERIGLGDPIAQKVVEEMGLHLATGIGNVLTLTQPDVIILGGRLGRAGSRLSEVVMKHLITRLAKRGHSFEVKTSMLGEEAGAIGVAANVLEEGLGSNYQLPFSRERIGKGREMP